MMSALSLFCLFFSLLSYKVIFWSDKEVSVSLIFILAICSCCMAQIFSTDGFNMFFSDVCKAADGSQESATVHSVKTFAMGVYSSARNIALYYLP